MQKRWHTRIVEYYLAVTKKGILPLVTTWMDLKDIILSEISQMEKDKYLMVSVQCGILKSRTHKSRVVWWIPGVWG